MPVAYKSQLTLASHTLPLQDGYINEEEFLRILKKGAS